MRGLQLPDPLAVEAAALQFRERYAPGQIGRLDIEAIVEFDLKLRIIPVRGVCRKGGKKGWASNDKKSIVVDRGIFRDQPTELRQLLAHETAHIDDQRQHFPAASFCSLEECRHFQSITEGALTACLEYHATLWAGHVLVPRRQLESVFKNAMRDTRLFYDELVDRFELGLDDDDALLRQIAGDELVFRVAQHFDVTQSWAERRIRDDGLWKRLGQQLATARAEGEGGRGRAG